MFRSCWVWVGTHVRGQGRTPLLWVLSHLLGFPSCFWSGSDSSLQGQRVRLAQGLSSQYFMLGLGIGFPG